MLLLPPVGMQICIGGHGTFGGGGGPPHAMKPSPQGGGGGGHWRGWAKATAIPQAKRRILTILLGLLRNLSQSEDLSILSAFYTGQNVSQVLKRC